jgi:hypothetical protein
VAVSVVYLFEIVEVKEQERDVLTGFFCPSELFRELLVEVAVVEKSGEIVPAG